MAMVQCKACGKIYDYEKNGCCPSCGAYNRPPRRERVDADGTVHHLTGQERRSVPHGGKVCFEKKECHEKKVCFEDEARKKPAHRSFSLTSGQRVLLVFMLFVVLGVIASFASSGRLHWGGSREPDTPSYPAHNVSEDPAVPSDDWLAWVPWQDALVGLADFDYADGQLTVWLYIGLPADQVLPDQIQLYGVDADAMDYSLEPELASEASYLGDSQWRLTFPLPSDNLYYDGTLGLSFLDDQGVEENSFLIPVFLTT